MSSDAGQARRFLITGGASGIGAACVDIALTYGWAVDVLDWQDPPERVAGRVRWSRLDLADTAARSQWIDQALGSGVSYFGAVMAAGMLAVEPEAGVHPELWTRTLAVNLVAPSHLVLSLASAWARGAGVVLIGSTAAVDGSFPSPAYAASKAGLQGTMASAIRRLSHREMRVNVVHPGAVDTPLRRKLLAEAPRNVIAQSPALQGRGMPAGDVATVAMALASNRAVSGVCVRVDGGARIAASTPSAARPDIVSQ